MNRSMIIILALIITLLAVITFKKKSSRNSQIPVIGLLQTASFPQLDQTRQGFLAEIKKIYGDKVTVLIQNAEGSLTQAQAIAASFKANTNITAIYAIATPAVQALKAEIKDKPIVFAAVSDPVGLHLRDDYSNITGSSDMADISKQIRLLHTVLPKIKKVALLYNPGEPNSVTLIKKMKEELTKNAIAFEEDAVNSQADVAAATAHAVKNTELILIPTDSTIASAFPLVKQIASNANIPIVTTWTGEKDGPILQFGVDYWQSGVQAARLMQKVIAGEKPIELPVEKPQSKIIFSRKELEKYSAVIPDVLKNSITLL